jgi:hypothetical protein
MVDLEVMPWDLGDKDAIGSLLKEGLIQFLQRARGYRFYGLPL